MRSLLAFWVGGACAPDPEAQHGEALVFDAQAGSWTRYTSQPAGHAIFSQHAATPGVYAGDGAFPWPAGRASQYRMETTEADAGSAISWEWHDRERQEPDGRFKDVTMVFVSVADGLAASNTLTASLRINGSSTDNQDEALSVPTASDSVRAVRWRPAQMADAESVQVTLSGESSAALEIDGIEAAIRDRGQAK